MGKLLNFKAVARPLNLGNRKEKLEKQRSEIIQRYEAIKRKGDNMFKK
ncbi:hypothetical protein [Neobacillus sp.]